MVNPITFKRRIKEKAKKLEERREKVVVACDDCGTEVLKEEMEDALEVADSHDSMRHDGERFATVNGIKPPRFSEEEEQEINDTLEEVLETMGAEEDA